jgi:hypothetical protein
MAMTKGQFQIAARALKYHVHDDPGLDNHPFTDTINKQVPKIGDPRSFESRDFYSLSRDMDELRNLGANMTITGSGGGQSRLVDPLRTIGTAFETDPRRSAKRDLWILKIGVGPKKILITGCHHAREWISVEVPYLLAEYLILNFNDNPTTPKELRIKHLLLNRQIWIVPMVNPDGHSFSISDDRDWRTNRRRLLITAQDIADANHPAHDPIRAPQLKFNGFNAQDRFIHPTPNTYIGIDINRNYPTASGLFQWGQETYFPGMEGQEGGRMTSRDPQDCGNGAGTRTGLFTGLTSNSEPEAQAIVSLMNANKFDAAISYHSFAEDILFPDDAQVANDQFTVGLASGMEDVNRSMVQGNSTLHQYKAIKGSQLYPDTGDLLDFTYSKFPGRPSYLPEVRPDDSRANIPKRMSGLPENEIFPTFVENLGPALAVINCAGFSSLSQQVVCNWQGPAPVCQMVSNCWQVFRNWVP